MESRDFKEPKTHQLLIEKPLRRLNRNQTTDIYHRAHTIMGFFGNNIKGIDSQEINIL